MKRREFIAALGGAAAGSVGPGASGAGGRQRNATWAGDGGPTADAGSVVDRWVTAFNSNDVDALVNLYAVDAILLGSTGLILQEGNEAILHGEGYALMCGKRVLYYAPIIALIFDAPFRAKYDQASDPQKKLTLILTFKVHYSTREAER